MNWSLLLSGLALCVSLGTVIYVQKRTDRRELVKWRRDTLTETTAKFVSEVSRHSNVLIRYLHVKPSEDRDDLFFRITDHMDEMLSLIVIMRVCESEHTEKLATEIFDHHNTYFNDLPNDDASDQQIESYFDLAVMTAPKHRNIDVELRKDLDNIRKPNMNERINKLKMFLMIGGS